MPTRTSSEIHNKKRISSDELHNLNCYHYLKTIFNAIDETNIPNELDVFLLFNKEEKFSNTLAYGNIYTEFVSKLEESIEKIIQTNGSFEKYLNREKNPLTNIEKESIIKLINVVYANDNKNLERVYEQIQSKTANQSPSDNNIKKSIANNFISNHQKTLNNYTPHTQEKALSRVFTVLGNEFRPQRRTNIPTIRAYNYNEGNTPQELRFGTQAQRVNGKVQISPLFKAWIEVQKHKLENRNKDKPITHIYFNNLPLDRESKGISGLLGIAGKREVDFSRKLHDLEKENTNIAVITLPADKGLMSGHDFNNTKETIPVDLASEGMFNIACENGEANPRAVKDFHISREVRNIIFKTPNESNRSEQEQIRDLLNKSFIALGLGLDQKKMISPAQRQAVWMHFIKYNLTDHIIKKLDPSSINFSCKDAIDRGGVSSAYYHLMKSFEINKPLTREEFDQALHAAPTMVKGRGMNHHLNVIWNAVDVYVNANHPVKAGEDKIDLADYPNKAWLIHWRDMNCPSERIESVLNKRIEQASEYLKKIKRGLTATEQENNKYECMNAIIGCVKSQHTQNIGDRRLLLEVLSRTMDLDATSQEENNTIPVTDKISPYKNLVFELNKSPTSWKKQLAGLMDMFIAVVLFLPTKAKTMDDFRNGFKQFRTGQDTVLNELTKNMTRFHNIIKPDEKSNNNSENNELEDKNLGY